MFFKKKTKILFDGNNSIYNDEYISFSIDGEWEDNSDKQNISLMHKSKTETIEITYQIAKRAPLSKDNIIETIVKNIEARINLLQLRSNRNFSFDEPIYEEQNLSYNVEINGENSADNDFVAIKIFGRSNLIIIISHYVFGSFNKNKISEFNKQMWQQI